MQKFSFPNHFFNCKYKLGCVPESQFFDKDVVVCLANSFHSAMTFRHRTSAVLFCKLANGGERNSHHCAKRPLMVSVRLADMCSAC